MNPSPVEKLSTCAEAGHSVILPSENRKALNKAKVAVLTSVHAVTDHRVFYKECLTLVQSGYDVVLIAPHHRDQSADGVRIRAIAKPRHRLERMTATVWQIYRAAIAERADIYHLHDPELLLIGWLLKMSGKRVVYDAHEDVPNDILIKEYIPPFSRQLLSRVAQFVEKGVASTFDGVIVASDHMLSGFYRSRKVVSVRNYPSLAFTKHHTGRLSDGTLRLIYTGSIRAVRGITPIVDAMGLLPSKTKASLHLYGPLSPANYIEELSVRKGFAKVNYGGVINFMEIPRYLSKADVGLALLQPTETYKDAIPTKLLEYLAAGLPVIASDFPVYRHIINRYGCGICVDPTDPAAIASAIEHLFEHPQEQAHMANNARRAGLECSWSTESDKLLSLYQSILEDH